MSIKLLLFFFAQIISQHLAYSNTITIYNGTSLVRSVVRNGNMLEGAGFGWDYLTEDTKYPPQIISYKDNKKTTDGKYLIPDCMAVENVKKTKYTDLADIISTTSSYVTKTSKSIKVSASVGNGVFSVGGSYGQDFFEMTDEQRKTNTVTTRTKYIDHRYTLLTNSRCPIDSKFNMAIYDLIFAVESDDDDLATYLAQTIIDDYGTHFVSKIKIGGILYSDDFIDEFYWSKMKTSSKTVQISASVSFSDEQIKASGSFDSTNKVDKSEFDDFKNNVKKTNFDAIGGRFVPGMSALDWGQTLENNYVAIDREAALISNLILASNFPDFSPSIVFKANGYVQRAIATYLNLNAVQGCLDRDSIMFNPQANYDSGNLCDEVFKFGGFYSTTQSCSQLNNLQECQSLSTQCTTNNLVTFSSSCPPGYEAETGKSSNPWISITQCKGGSSVKNGIVLFGGIYSSTHVNPITNAQSCPPNFQAQNIFDCSDNYMCVTKDLSSANVKVAVPFGGFVSSCFSGLPAACPNGLEKKPINIIKGCQIFYCTKYKSTNRPIRLKPPFVPKPTSYSTLKRNPYRK